MANAPAGWYPDPANPNEEVYWLGDSWSAARRTAGDQAGSPATLAHPAPSEPSAPPATDPDTAILPDAKYGLTSNASAAQVPSSVKSEKAAKRKNPGLNAIIFGSLALLLAIIPGASFIAFLPAIPAVIYGFKSVRGISGDRSKGITSLSLGAAAVVLGFIVSVSVMANAGGKTEGPSNVAMSPTPSTSATSEPTISVTPSAIPTVAAPVEPPPSEYGTYPAAQASFIQIIADSSVAYSDASTDLQKSQVLSNRDAALCAVVPGGRVDGWVGKISDIGANGDGLAYVAVDVAKNAKVKTWNNAFSDIGSDTLIQQDASFFQVLVPMEKDTKVVFSGDFLTGDSCLKRGNLTETFYAIDPNWIFRFSDVAVQ